MDISITRVPQDGRFTMMVDRREINVRVSTLPTIYGENVVMRLLDMSTNHVYTLDKLGMSDKDCKTISQTIERPYGMILSTGPTGSGKSTSLYSILQLLNKPDVNAITLEDPVEYRIDGIRQVQLNVRAGMTFASGLRSILRQDPDVIMVGEIRDSETAQIAVQGGPHRAPRAVHPAHQRRARRGFPAHGNAHRALSRRFRAPLLVCPAPWSAKCAPIAPSPMIRPAPCSGFSGSRMRKGQPSGEGKAATTAGTRAIWAGSVFSK